MRRIARIGGIVLAVLLLVVISLPFIVSANHFKPQLEAALGKALGRQVTVGNLKLSLWSGGVAADDLAISDDPAFGRGPFVRAKSLQLAVELGPLVFSRKLYVTALTIEQPEVTLLQSPAGDWNFSTLGGGKPAGAKPAAAPAGKDALDLRVKLVRIASGRFSAGKTGPREKPIALENVNLELRDFSQASSFPFSFSARIAGGGDIKLEGKAGPIDGANVELTPFAATLDIGRLDLAALPLAADSPGLAGLVSLRGKGESAGGVARLESSLKGERLRLARNGTPARRNIEFDFAVEHDLRKHAGSLRRGNLRVGAAPATLSGTYAMRGASTVLNMKFDGPKMAVEELAELLPPLGIALPSGSSLQGGFANAAFTVEGPVNALVTNGSVGLNQTRLANFDLGAKMALIEQLAGIHRGPNTEIETLSADLKMAREGMAAENIHFVAPAVGELTGAGTISPANALDFKMRVTVHTSGVAAGLSRIPVPFIIQGTAADPVFKPDLKTMASDRLQTLKQNAGKAAGGLIDRLFGGKKK